MYGKSIKNGPKVGSGGSWGLLGALGMLLGPPGGSLEVFWWILGHFGSPFGSNFRLKMDFVLHRFLLILLECLFRGF